MLFPVLELIEDAREPRRSVSVNPGRTLLIVMQVGSSRESDFAHDAIAPLNVLESPMFGIGSLTDVDIMLTILPMPTFSISGTTPFTNVCDACRCLLNGASKSSTSLSSRGPPGGPAALLIRMWHSSIEEINFPIAS